jgi:hypothetical protein
MAFGRPAFGLIEPSPVVDPIPACRYVCFRVSCGDADAKE